MQENLRGGDDSGGTIYNTKLVIKLLQLRSSDGMSDIQLVRFGN